ncbi:MAG: hypothetical protein JRI23_19605 [Deltaproteobacteria bacterium]|nr:hypothetical protein [Deltaproteobacteria bacterium]MBW2534072.1 hypothetical protein [Deltaproteobacteria bacterium]
MKRIYSLTALSLPLAAALVLHYGCGSSDETQGGPGTGGAAASGAGSGTGGVGFGGNGTGTATGTAQAGGNGQGASGTAGGGTGLSDAGDFDADFTYDAPAFDADLQDACVDETAEAEPVPLDIYFMLDASTSMSSPAGTGTAGDCNVDTNNFTPSVNSRWCKAINSIAGYVSSPQAQDNRAALCFFRRYSNYNCNGSGYDTPYVGLGLLPGSYSGHAQTLVESASPNFGLNAAYPHDATPTEGALRGLAQYTAANQTTGRIIIGILVTDGAPTSCDTSDGTLAGIAQNHFNSTGIHTFMVGMTGANFTRLENWADYNGALSHPDNPGDTCGGSYSSCHHYNVGDGDPTVFINALNQIQNAVLSCTFQIPSPSQGVLDPDLVIVEYYPGGTPPATVLPRRNDLNDCNNNGDVGWYYDNNSSPTVINLCPNSCNTVQADANAEVKIRIACQGS